MLIHKQLIRSAEFDSYPEWLKLILSVCLSVCPFIYRSICHAGDEPRALYLPGKSSTWRIYLFWKFISLYIPKKCLPEELACGVGEVAKWLRVLPGLPKDWIWFQHPCQMAPDYQFQGTCWLFLAYFGYLHTHTIIKIKQRERPVQQWLSEWHCQFLECRTPCV